MMDRGKNRPKLPDGLDQRLVPAPGGNLFIQIGGAGPAVLLLHGNAQSGDMWGPLAEALISTHTVIIPDLRGMCRSSRPAAAYDKKSQGNDLRDVVRKLGFESVVLVAHDLGAMVAYSYAAQYQSEVDRLVFMEAPLPGIEPWPRIVTNPVLWHFHFGGPDAERLVAGRERIYFDHFWNFAADPSQINDDLRNHYAAQYATPGAMGASFGQFAAFARDAQDNASLARHRLAMPVLAIGGERAFGDVVGATMRAVASNVREIVIPNVGHWLAEEAADTLNAHIQHFIGCQ